MYTRIMDKSKGYLDKLPRDHQLYRTKNLYLK